MEYECPPYSECGGGICDPSYAFRDLFYETNPDVFFPPLRFAYDWINNSFYVSIDVKPYHRHIVAGVGYWEDFVDKDGDRGRRYVFVPDEKLFPVLRELADELLSEVTKIWNTRWVAYPPLT